jgi:hypothetical protein
MIKVRKKWFYVGLVLLGAAFACLILPPYADYCNRANYEDQYRCTPYEIITSSLSFLETHNALITAIATGFIAWFTVVLAGVGRQQIRDTRILQRAYLAVEPTGINPYISESGSAVTDKIVGHVSIENVGRLPARNISIDRALIKYCKSGELDETAFLVGATPPMTIVLPPGTKARLGSDSLPASDLEKPGYIYVYGRVDYTDGFNVPRHTWFCHRYPCIKRDGQSISTEHARQHRHGNDAD